MTERGDEILSLNSIRVFLGMLFGPTDLLQFKLEMILEKSFLLVGENRNDLKNLYFMYSE